MAKKKKTPAVHVPLEIDGEPRKQHVWDHTTPKFEIMVCGKRFSRQDILRQRRHVARNITEVDCVTCMDRLIKVLTNKISAVEHRSR